MAVERLIGPLKFLWGISITAFFLSGQPWLFVPLVLVYPIIDIIKRFAAGSDGLEGWAVEKASRGGTSDTWELRLPNEVTTRRNLSRYVEAASRRGYVATGPSFMSVRTITTTFVRAPDAGIVAPPSERAVLFAVFVADWRYRSRAGSAWTSSPSTRAHARRSFHVRFSFRQASALPLTPAEAPPFHL